MVDTARASLGAAVQVDGTVAAAARDAFVHAMSRASILAALVAALGAVIAWRHLPAGEVTQLDGSWAAGRLEERARRAGRAGLRR